GVSGERSKDRVQRGRDLPEVQGAGWLNRVIPGWSVRTRPQVRNCAPEVDATRRPGMTAPPSHAPPIHRRHLQLRQFDAVDAAYVQRHHVAAIGLLAAREDVDAAIDAELVVDRVLVEEIFLQVFLAGAELKTLRVEEGEM